MSLAPCGSLTAEDQEDAAGKPCARLIAGVDPYGSIDHRKANFAFAAESGSPEFVQQARVRSVLEQARSLSVVNADRRGDDPICHIFVQHKKRPSMTSLSSAVKNSRSKCRS